MSTPQSTAAKALKVNQDPERYGAFAEIGAGQEVARHFFQAGRASQTIAKSMSAYDMTYSDEIYGKEKNGRYVCESRLVRMLEKEYGLLIRRLGQQRGEKTSFFAFANTVATGTPESPRCHGWMGIRFQTRPGGESNDIVLHVRMMDRHRLEQQNALGMLGVNLVEAAFYGIKKAEEFIPRLVEGLKKDQVVIDVMKFSGPDLKHFDDRMMNLELMRLGLSEAILFAPTGEILHLSDAIYGKGILIQRGTYQPLTISHADVIEKGLKQLRAEMVKAGEKKTDVFTALEIVMSDKMKARDLDDISTRIDLAGASGFHVLVSNFPLFYQLKVFIRRFSQSPLALVMGASKLDRLFSEAHYANLEGGMMEGLGKLLDDKSKVYVYPHKTDKICLMAKLYRPEGIAAKIYEYFFAKGQITDIAGCDEAGTYLHSQEVRKAIEKKTKGWEKMVPTPAADLIKKRKLFA